MSLASRGQGLSSAIGRQASHAVQGARSIHILGPRPSPAIVAEAGSAGNAERLFRHTKNFVNQFFAHLTTPGFSHPVAGATRPFSNAGFNSIRQSSMHQSVSSTARHGLSQGSGGRFVPRLRPAPVPGSVAHVGLGTARNFSTTRPLFQHIVENVPIAGRTLYNADLDFKQRSDKKKRIVKGGKEGKENVRSSGLNVLDRSKRIEAVEVDGKAAEKEELDHYFPFSPVPAVTTYLSIPMAPTPTSRFPLPSISAESTHPLLPLPELSTILSSHHTHSLRINSLFMRLDGANVWDKGVSCHAYGESCGMCTVLRVEFKGWTMAMVRSVIGEAGQGWCVLEEVVEDEGGLEGSALKSRSPSQMADRDRASLGWGPEMDDIDPATTMILPTLSLSSSILTAASSMSNVAPLSPPASMMDFSVSDVSSLSDLGNNDSTFDPNDEVFGWGARTSENSWSDVEIGPGSVVRSARMSASSQLNWGGLSLSSDFSDRVDLARRG